MYDLQLTWKFICQPKVLLPTAHSTLALDILGSPFNAPWLLSGK